MRSNLKSSLFLIGAMILIGERAYSTCIIDPQDQNLIKCDVGAKQLYGYTNKHSNDLSNAAITKPQSIEYNITSTQNYGAYTEFSSQTLGDGGHNVPFDKKIHPYDYMENVTIKGGQGFKSTNHTGVNVVEKPLDWENDINTNPGYKDTYEKYRKYVDRSFGVIMGFPTISQKPTYDIGNLTLKNVNLNVYANLRFNSLLNSQKEFNIVLDDASIHFYHGLPDFINGNNFNIVGKGSNTNTFTAQKTGSKVMYNGALVVDTNSALRLYQLGDLSLGGRVNSLAFRNFRGADVKEGGELIIDRSIVAFENTDRSKGTISLAKDASMRVIGSGSEVYTTNIHGENYKEIELQNSKIHLDNHLVLNRDTAISSIALDSSIVANENTAYNVKMDSGSTLFSNYTDIKNGRVVMGDHAYINSKSLNTSGDNTEFVYYKDSKDPAIRSVKPSLNVGVLNVKGNTTLVNTLLNYDNTSTTFVAIEKDSTLTLDRSSDALLNDSVTKFSTISELLGKGTLRNIGYSNLKLQNLINGEVAIQVLSPSSIPANQSQGVVLFEKGLVLNDRVESGKTVSTLSNNGLVEIDKILRGSGEITGSGKTSLYNGAVVDPGLKLYSKDKTDMITFGEDTVLGKDTTLNFDFVSATDFDKIGYSKNLVKIEDIKQPGVTLDFANNINVTIDSPAKLSGEYTVFAEKNSFPSINPSSSFATDIDLTNVTNQIISAGNYHFANEIKAVDKGGINNSDITLIFSDATTSSINNLLSAQSSTQNGKNIATLLANNSSLHGVQLKVNQFQNFAKTFHPELFGTNISVMQNSLDNLGQSVLRRESHLNGLWGNSSFVNGKIDGQNGLMDIDFKLDDIVIGRDFIRDEASTTGWYIGYGHTSFTPKSINTKFKSDGINIGLYHDVVGEGYSVATQLGYGAAFNNSKRVVDRGSDSITLSDDFMTNSLSARGKLMGATKKFAGVEIKPNISLAGAIVSQGRVSESGDDITAFEVDRKVSYALVAGAGLEMSYPEINESIGLKPMSYVKLEYDVLGKTSHSINANLKIAKESSLEYTGQSRGNASAVIGLGLQTTKLPVNINFGVNYEKDTHASQFGVGAGFTYKF